MRQALLAAATAAALSFPALALAGPPDNATQMADTWLVQSHGQTICRVKLSGQGGVRTDGGCGEAMPASVSGWRPTAEGVALIGSDGAAVASFTRWSESLYVAPKGGPDLQLSRAPAGQANP